MGHNVIVHLSPTRVLNEILEIWHEHIAKSLSIDPKQLGIKISRYKDGRALISLKVDSFISRDPGVLQARADCFVPLITSMVNEALQGVGGRRQWPTNQPQT